MGGLHGPGLYGMGGAGGVGGGGALRFSKQSNAYMLVYVRKEDWERIMCPVYKVRLPSGSPVSCCGFSRLARRPPCRVSSRLLLSGVRCRAGGLRLLVHGIRRQHSASNPDTPYSTVAGSTL